MMCDYKGKGKRMKKYRIGEIADLMNVSAEMIRYYERQGIIKPERTDSNYREYTALDQFALMGAVSLANYDLNIAKISQVEKRNYSRTMQDHLDHYVTEIKASIRHEQLMIQRAKELSDRFGTATRNVGRKWIKRIESSYRLPYLNGHGDDYGELLYPSEFKCLFSSSAFTPFLDAAVMFSSDGEAWFLCIDEKYLSDAALSDFPHMEHIPAHYALCTIVDVGKIGSFCVDKALAVLEEAGAEHIREDIPAMGYIVYRGVEQDSYQRLIELHIPIEA